MSDQSSNQERPDDWPRGGYYPGEQYPGEQYADEQYYGSSSASSGTGSSGSSRRDADDSGTTRIVPTPGQSGSEPSSSASLSPSIPATPVWTPAPGLGGSQVQGSPGQASPGTGSSAQQSSGPGSSGQGSSGQGSPGQYGSSGSTSQYGAASYGSAPGQYGSAQAKAQYAPDQSQYGSAQGQYSSPSQYSSGQGSQAGASPYGAGQSSQAGASQYTSGQGSQYGSSQAAGYAPGPGSQAGASPYGSGQAQYGSAGSYGSGQSAAGAQGAAGYGAAGQYGSAQSYPTPGTPGPGASLQASPRQSADSKGFLAALFDFSFTSFVTTRIIKVLYILITVLVCLTALIYTIVAFRISPLFGILTLVIGDPLFIIIVMGFWRLVLEAFVVVFRISEDVRSLRERADR